MLTVSESTSRPTEMAGLENINSDEMKMEAFFLVVVLLACVQTAGMKLGKPWTDDVWCNSVLNPHWPFAYLKSVNETVEGKGRTVMHKYQKATPTTLFTLIKLYLYRRIIIRIWVILVLDTVLLINVLFAKIYHVVWEEAKFVTFKYKVSNITPYLETYPQSLMLHGAWGDNIDMTLVLVVEHV